MENINDPLHPALYEKTLRDSNQLSKAKKKSKKELEDDVEESGEETESKKDEEKPSTPTIRRGRSA